MNLIRVSSLSTVSRLVRTMASFNGFPVADVRDHPDQDTIKLVIPAYRPSDLSQCSEREFTFNRKRTEILGVFLPRIGRNINSHFDKKRKTKGKKSSNLKLASSNGSCGTDEASLSVQSTLKVELMDTSDYPLSHDVTTEEALRDGYKLNIDDCIFILQRNIPRITSWRLSSVSFVGFPVVPFLTCEFCDISLCQFQWSIHPPTQSPTPPPLDSANWSITPNTGHFFTPTDDLLNFWIKLVIIPWDSLGRKGDIVQTISQLPVSIGPVQAALNRRMTLTPKFTESGQLRLVSYNLLANIYADSDYSRTKLFPYCPSEFLSMDYRQHLLLKEIINYHADIICLQEVDAGMFRHFFYPALKMAGYDGFYQKKLNISEGLCIFYRSDRLSFDDNASVESLTEELYRAKDLSNVCQSVVDVEDLHQCWADRGQALAVCVLRDKIHPDTPIIVANTHLYFSPDADHIRLLQTAVILDYLKKLDSRWPIKPMYLIAADFNSNPASEVCKLLSLGRVEEQTFYVSKKESSLTSWKCPELKHCLSPLKSVYSDPIPPFTNFTEGFKEVLDHIYFDSDHLYLVRAIPLPSLEEVTESIALPNKDFPSDHLALVADLEYVKK